MLRFGPPLRATAEPEGVTGCIAGRAQAAVAAVSSATSRPSRIPGCRPLGLPADGPEASARLGVRGVAPDGLPERGRSGGRVAAHEVDVPTEYVHGGGA